MNVSSAKRKKYFLGKKLHRDEILQQGEGGCENVIAPIFFVEITSDRSGFRDLYLYLSLTLWHKKLTQTASTGYPFVVLKTVRLPFGFLDIKSYYHLKQRNPLLRPLIKI